MSAFYSEPVSLLAAVNSSHAILYDLSDWANCAGIGFDSLNRALVALMD